jgi:hypothetical protein
VKLDRKLNDKMVCFTQKKQLWTIQQATDGIGFAW